MTGTAEEYPLAMRIPLALLLIVVLIVGLIGNGLICWTIYRNKEMRNVFNNWFILNMAFADLGVLVLGIYFPIRTYIKGYWDFSYSACQFNGFLNSQLMLASILTLTMISIHQYLTVVSKWSHARLRRAAIAMLIYVWLHSTALSILPLIGITAYDLKRGRGQCSVKIPESSGEKATASVYMISGFLLPLLIMSVSYYRIMKIVSKHARRISQMSSNASMDRKAMQRQVAVTMIMVLIVFVVCWSPFLIMSLFGAYLPVLSNPTLANVAYLLGFANSCCNPIVLGTRNRTFTHEYLAIFGKIKATCPCFSPGEKPQESDTLASPSTVEASHASVVFTNSDTVKIGADKQL